MSYLKLTRSRILIVAFVSFALFAMLFPAFDLHVSAFFFDGTSFPRDAWWQKLQKDALDYFLCISVLLVILLYAWNRLLRQRVLEVDGRRVLFLALVLVIGAGLIVNVCFKNQFGRARPRDVAEFGGQRVFTPAFVISDQCRTNCSFSSGDSSAGFFALALVMALRRRRAWYAAAFGFGAIISVSRLASGAHFFSDVVVSFFVMLIVADVLHHYLVLTRPVGDAAPVPAVQPPLAGAPVSDAPWTGMNPAGKRLGAPQLQKARGRTAAGRIDR